MLPSSLKSFLRTNLPAEMIELEIIDWSKTLDWNSSKAYLCSRTGHGILINRENVADYEKFREKIIKALMNLKDPDTGRRVVKKVCKKEELFKGPHLINAPDILVELAETYELQEKLGKNIFETVSASRVPISANHYKDGVLILFGKSNFQQGLRISDINIVDIAPTILYSLGFPIPQDMDGRVITEAFSKEFLRNNPIHYSKIPLQMESKPGSITPADEDAIADRLRSLGYME
jgi:predicted AlkP superfamily phosphohydrolase/phosphomutase